MGDSKTQSSGRRLGGALGLALVMMGHAAAITPRKPVASYFRVAPEKCLLFIHSTGFEAPQANGASATERMFADPEIQSSLTKLRDAAIKQLMAQSGSSGGEGSIRTSLEWARVVLSHPFTAYVGDIQLGPDGKPAATDMGVIASLGERLPELRQIVEGWLTMLPPEAIQDETIAGLACKRVQMPDRPYPIFVGFRNDSVLIAMGDGAMEKLLNREKGKAPAWLEQMFKSRGVPRVGILIRGDLAAITSVVNSSPDESVKRNWAGMGLADARDASLIFGLDEEGCVTHLRLAGPKFAKSTSALDAAAIAHVPQDVLGATLIRCDLQETLDEVRQKLAADQPEQAQVLEQGLAMTKSQLGIDLETSLLQPLGDQWSFYTPRGTMVGIPNMVLSVSVDDSATLGMTEDKVLEIVSQQLGGAPKGQTERPVRGPQLKSTKLLGRDANYVSGIMVTPAWCLADKELGVSLALNTLQDHFAFPTKSGRKTLAEHPTVKKALLNKHPLLAISYADSARSVGGLLKTIPTVMALASAELKKQGIEWDPAMLPKPESVQKHLRPAIWSVHRTEDGVEWIARGTFPGVRLVGANTAAALGLAIPAIQAARAAAGRTAAENAAAETADENAADDSP